MVLHDTEEAQLTDLSAQFYLTEDSIGTNRASACRDRLQELNTSVVVGASSVELTEQYICQFQVCTTSAVIFFSVSSVRMVFVQVVVCTHTLTKQAVAVDEICHRHSIGFIKADTCGVFASVFCDFGKGFQVLDIDGMCCSCAEDVTWQAIYFNAVSLMLQARSLLLVS